MKSAIILILVSLTLTACTSEQEKQAERAKLKAEIKSELAAENAALSSPGSAPNGGQEQPQAGKSPGNFFDCRCRYYWQQPGDKTGRLSQYNNEDLFEKIPAATMDEAQQIADYSIEHKGPRMLRSAPCRCSPSKSK